MTINEFGFPTKPEIGIFYLMKSWYYVLIRAQRYTRKDGQPSAILTWGSTCTTCCRHFTVTTTVRGQQYVTRKCPLHRKHRGRVRKIKVEVL